MRWYAVFTRPRQEALAEAHLLRQGFTVFLPRVVDGRGERPLFTSYLFLAGDDDLPLFTINGTRGVRRVLTFGDRPQEVREVGPLREVADATGRIHVSLDAEDRPRPGDIVRLRETCPFFGYLCEVVSVDPAGVHVLIHLFARSTPATVRDEDVGEIMRRSA